MERADRVEHLERVVRAAQLDVDDRFPTRGAERGDEGSGLLDRRAKVYESTRNPRADLARRELARFLELEGGSRRSSDAPVVTEP